MPVRPALLLVLAALLLSACGATDGIGGNGRGDEAQRPGTTTGPDGGGDGDAPANPLDIPDEVPLEADAPADPEAERVVRAWSDALRAGEVDEAAALFATPSRAQNGTPVLTLRDRRATLAFNDSLPCGAQLTEATSDGDFLVATLRLTDRPGGGCGPGAGGTARTAFEVRDGRITGFYRLPDDPAEGRGGPELPPPAPDGEPERQPGIEPDAVV
jgi:hypothetical protein